MGQANTQTGTHQPDWAVGQQQEDEKLEDKGGDDDPDDLVDDPKKTGRRESFNMREDELLCNAWLAPSLDPIHGTEQKGTTLWNNIHIWFHEHKHFAPYSDAVIRKRESKSLNHHWYTIQEAVSKYCDNLKHLIARWPSGAQIHEQVSSFGWICILR
nr:uncharacterized protein LOC109752497 [Aegilops tauschii subsp. strangulata]